MFKIGDFVQFHDDNGIIVLVPTIDFRYQLFVLWHQRNYKRHFTFEEGIPQMQYPNTLYKLL